MTSYSKIIGEASLQYNSVAWIMNILLKVEMSRKELFAAVLVQFLMHKTESKRQIFILHFQLICNFCSSRIWNTRISAMKIKWARNDRDKDFSFNSAFCVENFQLGIKRKNLSNFKFSEFLTTSVEAVEEKIILARKTNCNILDSQQLGTLDHLQLWNSKGSALI